MDCEAFEYDSLEPDHVRILHLAPGLPGDPFVGTLHIAKLQDSIAQYDALSYLSGDPTRTSTILIHGRKLGVAANLARALGQLRYSDKTFVIWIDAICINQADLKERAAQVQMMAQVYSNAATVRAWIHDPAIDPSDPAFTNLKEFKFDEHNVDENYGLGFDPNHWQQVKLLCRNEYWLRVWVQQEICYARRLIIHCVGREFPESAFTDLCSASATMILWSMERLPMIEVRAWEDFLYPVVTNLPFDNKNIRQHRFKLRDILYQTSELRSSDPRDRFYGLMNLGSDYVEGGIEIDYGRSPLDVMVDMFKYHIRQTRDV